MQAEKKCYITGYTFSLERHHVMNGPFRSYAEEDGLWVWLTHEAHMYVHEHPNLARWLKKHAQIAYEDKLTKEGMPAYAARDAWMKRYKKNYL